MADKDLKLNSISRYSKKSSRLFLEIHCEIPAGCGGVVVRWINPDKPIPFHIWMETNGECDLFLDGKRILSSVPSVEVGEHVLAFHISGFQPGCGLLRFVGYPEYPGIRRGRAFYEKPRGVRSLPDKTWKYSLIEPDDDAWMYPDFDDSEWPAMISERLPKEVKENVDGSLFIDFPSLQGSKGLGITDKRVGKRIWIRRKFLIEKKRFRPGEDKITHSDSPEVLAFIDTIKQVILDQINTDS